MVRPCFVLLLAVLVFFSGIESIHSEIELKDGGGINESSGDHGTTLPTVEKQLARSKCNSSQEEECCTAAIVGDNDYKVFTEMSARGRHTVVNMTNAGLQEYTMYFAVKGEWIGLTLSKTSSLNKLYYGIWFDNFINGRIWIYEHLSSVSWRTVRKFETSNIISTEKFTYYYVTISGDTLEVGRRGEPPLLTYTSTRLRRLRYFSFAQWGSAPSAALYDCTAE